MQKTVTIETDTLSVQLCVKYVGFVTIKGYAVAMIQ